LMSCVMNDRHRAAGRGGAGAVMGSKNLKAVVALGTKKIKVADPEKLKKVNLSITDSMRNGPQAEFSAAFSEYGTGALTSDAALSGDSPVKNWGGIGVVDFGEESSVKLGAPVMDPVYKTKKYACANCPLGCGADYEVKDGDWPIGETFRPEYETMASFGSLCLNDNAESIIMCNEICNRSGLDTISAGATVAWAIECFENGVFNKEETGGIELNWGNAKAIVDITEAIANQTGFGKVLALGSRGAAENLGKGFEYLQTVKGVELPMHDPRFSPGHARTYWSDPSPARHVKGGMGLAQLQADDSKYDISDTGVMDLAMTAGNELINAAGLCLFCGLAGVETIVQDQFEAVTGRLLSMEDQINLGTRIINMRHAFNLREGYNPSEQKMPSRSLGEEPQQEGPLEGVTIDHKTLQSNFCKAIGWDEETWKPSRESLEALGGMDDVITDLYG